MKSLGIFMLIIIGLAIYCLVAPATPKETITELPKDTLLNSDPSVAIMQIIVSVALVSGFFYLLKGAGKDVTEITGLDKNSPEVKELKYYLLILFGPIILGSLIFLIFNYKG